VDNIDRVFTTPGIEKDPLYKVQGVDYNTTLAARRKFLVNSLYLKSLYYKRNSLLKRKNNSKLLFKSTNNKSRIEEFS